MALGERRASGHDWTLRQGIALVVLSWLALMVAAGSSQDVAAQSAAPAPSPRTDATQPKGDWGSGTSIDRTTPPTGSGAPPQLRPSMPVPGTPPANTTVVPRTAPDARPTAVTGELRLEAFLTDDGKRIEQGLLWHAFEDVAVTAAADQRAKARHVGSWKEPSPTLRLPPGNYLVTATFGRAHMTRKVTIRQGTAAAERFVLNAGGLRITAQLSNGDPIPEIAFGYDILAGDFDQGGARAKVLSGVKPGLIIRLNAGIYQIVSTYGDANSIVRSDVTVEAGKLTEARITHHAARVTFKLVTRPGGDALADTHWSIASAQGERVRDSDGALPSHILAAGAYEVQARQGNRTFKRSFIVTAGEPQQIEVVIPAAGG